MKWEVLKDCPLCGSKSHLRVYRHSLGTKYMAMCSNGKCGCKTTKHPSKKHIKFLWSGNSRPKTLQESKQELERELVSVLYRWDPIFCRLFDSFRYGDREVRVEIKNKICENQGFIKEVRHESYLTEGIRMMERKK